MFARLLAKSSDTPDAPRTAETLPGHTALVMAAADRLLKARGMEALRALRLSDSELPNLERLVRLSAFLHDLGKASDHFQQMVRGQRDAPQLVRHEALSLWLAWPGQPLASWLEAPAGGRRELLLAVAAAAGHHRKFWSAAVASSDSGAGRHIQLLLTHPDFVQALKLGSSRLGLPPPPPTQQLRLESTPRARLDAQLDAWATEWEDQVQPEGRADALLAAVKAFLVNADVAGSALPRSGGSPEWISRALAGTPASGAFAEIAALRLGAKPARPFQDEVASSGAAVTLGTRRLRDGKDRGGVPVGRPAVSQAQAVDHLPDHRNRNGGLSGLRSGGARLGRLDHSRAAIDLEIFGLDDGTDGCRDFDRLEALRVWSAEVTVCTVDTVLGLLHNQRKGLYAWPSLAEAAVVFDEIHAYDERLFSTLLRFLEALPGIPLLLMTASLPASRLEALKEAVQRIHGSSLRKSRGRPNWSDCPV